MFTVSTPHFLINVITKPEVADHLVPNIKNFEIVYYIREDFRGGKPKEAEENNMTRVQLLCSRNKLGEIMNYVKEYYVKRYDAVCHYEEVNVQV